jgi:drug/metabolite transporter (DMT)-like permease
MQCVADCDTHHPKNFEQPVLQTLQMFIGESGCWLVVFASFLFNRFVRGSKSADEAEYTPVARRDSSDLEEELDAASDDMDDDVAHGNLTASQTLIDPTNIPTKPFADAEVLAHEREPLTGWRITILALPAICDILGTTLMNAGLLFVAASIYQMTRGALVLFVGLFSVIFLRRHLGGWKWASLFIVVAGVALVGLAGVIEQGGPSIPGDSQPNPDKVHDNLIRAAISSLETHTPAETILGITMIAGAQIFTASQFVLEESIMERYSMDPIQVVGWEGVFGFLVTLLGTGILHLAIGRTARGQGGYFDAREGFHEMFTNRTIAVTSLLIMVSIGYVSLPPSKRVTERELLLTYISHPAASTSSASPSRAKSPQQPAAQSTRAARCSSGSSRWVWAGSPSSGCKSSVSRSWSGARRCSTRLSTRLLLLG